MTGHRPDLLEQFHAERESVVRRRVRTILLVLTAFWALQLAFGDRSLFRSFAAILLVYRLPAFGGNLALYAWLRKKRSLRSTETATVAWVGVMLVSAAGGLFFARPDFAPLYVGSFVLGLLAVVPAMGLRWVPTAACHALAVAAFLPSGLVVFAEHRPLFVVALAIVALPYAVIVVTIAIQERVQRSDFFARAQLAEANARLEADQEARTRLFVNLSHDLRTPLAVIGGESELLLRRPRPDAEVASLQRIAANAATVVELADQLLEVARLDAGKMPRRSANVDVTALARELVAQLQPANDALRISVFDPREPAIARADPWHVQRILINLVSNAVRELRGRPGAGNVEVRPIAETDAIVVDVVDDGPGVPPERRARLFERFSYFAPAGSTASGIGLALARELAEMDGGTLELLEADRTTFRLRLPRAAGEADPVPWHAPREAATPVEEARSAQDVTRRGRLLVVEDYPDMADLLARVLAPHFDVECVGGVREALAAARAATPTAILADVMLPDGDGYDLLAAVREDAALAGVPFVLVSALSEPGERARGLAAGADDYVVKPFAAEELVARLLAATDRALERESVAAEQRRDLVMELHDGLGGTLARAALMLASAGDGSADPVRGARAAVREGLHEVRSLMWATSRSAVPWDEVVAVSRRQIEEMAAAGDLHVSFRTSRDDERAHVSSRTAHALRRISQEAVTNVLRHASARSLDCELVLRDGNATVTIRDDGRGIPCALRDDGRGIPCERPPGRGIPNMLRRAEALGGRMTIGSPDGESGTVVSATIPVDAAAPASARSHVSRDAETKAPRDTARRVETPRIDGARIDGARTGADTRRSLAR